MKKQIAVLMCAISFDNQRKILEGIMTYAREQDLNVFVFTCHINYMEKEMNKLGAFQIMDLPDFQFFDGAVLVKNTIQYELAAERLEHRLKKSQIPAVSIDANIEAMHMVKASGYEAQAQVVEHLIVTHGIKEICYVSGPLSNTEGEERYLAYCDTLKKYGLAYRKENVYHGCFDGDSGRRAVEQFSKKLGTCPLAIVCANDIMALGVMEQLEIYGYHVPDDVLVMGFDNDEAVQYQNPSLTTIDKKQFEIGYRAVELLMNESDRAIPQKITVPARMIVRGSCGCNTRNSVDMEQLKKKYIKNKLVMQRVANNMKNMISEFSGMGQPEELIQALEKYVLETDMDSFYLCMCEREKVFGCENLSLDGQLDISNINTEYTNKISIPMAYEKGGFGSYPEFDKGGVLPAQCLEHASGNMYIVVPVYYQNCCYGYCVSGNSDFPLENELFYSWIMNIGIGFENIRKWMLLNETVSKLNGMWAYDMLTHIYNRAGFFYHSEKLLTELKENKADAFLLFVDIDGLKLVNDNLGHEMGDLCIKTVAEILRESLIEKQLLMRYGGDEFVIFGVCVDEAQVMAQIDGIETAMQKRSEDVTLRFTVDASVGFMKYPAEAIKDLNELIELADKKMYEEKKRKRKERQKARRGNEGN